MRRTQPTAPATEWAAVLPFCNRVFKKEELGACCRNKSAMQFSLSLAPTSLADILNNIRAQSLRPHADARWKRRSLEETAGFILEHLHRPLHVHLVNIGTLIDMMVASHIPDAGIAVRHLKDAFSEFKQEIEGHLFLEEDLFYPALGRKGQKPTEAFVRALRTQHDVLIEKIKPVYFTAGRVTQLTDGCEGSRALFATLKRVEILLLDQIYFENNLLFPRTIPLTRPAAPRKLLHI